MVQLVECLPNTHKALGLIPKITLQQEKPQLDTVGFCLQCQHGEGHTEGQEVQSSLAIQGVRTQLGIHEVMSKSKLRIRDSSASKGTYCQDQCLEFDPWNPQGGKRKPTLQSSFTHEQ